jgi:hypothetical protein
MLKTSCIAAALIGLAATLSAQVIEAPDTFKVNYYSNSNPESPCDASSAVTTVPDATVRITNVGTQIGSKTDPSGNLCALIYVLQPDQELAECCGCRITPDGLLTLSVDVDLTSNPLTPVTLTTGDIKIISSTSCNAAAPVPAAGIRAWATHIQNDGSTTETQFTDSTLSAGEMKRLASRCGAIINNGSSFGQCVCPGGGA